MWNTHFIWSLGTQLRDLKWVFQLPVVIRILPNQNSRYHSLTRTHDQKETFHLTLWYLLLDSYMPSLWNGCVPEDVMTWSFQKGCTPLGHSLHWAAQWWGRLRVTFRRPQATTTVTDSPMIPLRSWSFDRFHKSLASTRSSLISEPLRKSLQYQYNFNNPFHTDGHQAWCVKNIRKSPA